MSITLLTIFGAFIILQTVVARDCDNLGILVYDDMKCTPNFEKKSDKCPSSYDCPDIKISTDTCYFKGETVRQGQHLNGTAFCEFGCSCSRGNEGMKFSCAIGECGQFGPPPPDGCYFSYTLEKCCGGQYCPPRDRPVHKCTFDGQEYREGERFFPKNSCSMCLCKKGFQGKIEEPFCIPRQCDGQIKNQAGIQKSCAPVYTRKEDINNGILCCPNFYTCPDGNEVIEGNSTSSLKCQYGEKTLKVGQSFKKEAKQYSTDYKVSCKCNIPPLVTCVVDN